mgnify:CR=1 FL=1
MIRTDLVLRRSEINRSYCCDSLRQASGHWTVEDGDDCIINLQEKIFFCEANNRTTFGWHQDWTSWRRRRPRCVPASGGRRTGCTKGWLVP